MLRLMRVVLKNVVDPEPGKHFTWFAFALLLDVFLLTNGLLFSLGGGDVIVATKAFSIFAGIPGGLHTHGAVQLVLAAGLSWLLFYQLRVGQPHANVIRWVMSAVTIYFSWTSLAFYLAPHIPGGARSILGVITWATLAMWPLILSVALPAEDSLPVEDQLRQAAHAAGLAPADVEALVAAYRGEASDRPPGHPVSG